MRRGRRNKYGNKQAVLDGVKFASRLEMNIWIELKEMEARREISFLRRQVTFAVVVCEQHICRYVADYVFVRNGEQVIADAKGFVTPEFRLKAKLLKATRGIDIVCWKSVTQLVKWRKGQS